MSLSKSWQFIGGTDSAAYLFYDRLRRRVNGGLVAFLSGHLPSGDGDRRDFDGEPCLRVLEAGSGTAFASSLFAARGEVSMAVCMDIDRTALVEARRRDPKLCAVVGDLMQMPFKDGTFDLAFSNSTVEHLDRPGKAVGEMRRVVHDSGRVFVGLPYLWGPLFFQRFIRRSVVGIWIGTVFSRPSLDRLLRSAGLRPMAHRRYFWNFFIGAVAAKSEPAGSPGARADVPC